MFLYIILSIWRLQTQKNVVKSVSFFILIISYKYFLPSCACLTSITTWKTLYRSISPSSPYNLEISEILGIAHRETPWPLLGCFRDKRYSKSTFYIVFWYTLDAFCPKRRQGVSLVRESSPETRMEGTKQGRRAFRLRSTALLWNDGYRICHRWCLFTR